MKITTFTKYPNEEEIVSRIEIRDKSNNIIEEIDFDDNGQQILRITYEYDAEGKLLTSTQHDEDNQLIEKKTIHYDTKGAKIGSETVFPDNSITKEIIKKDGNTISIITEDEDGEFEGSEERILTENGLTKQLTQTNFMNKITALYEYEYDEKNQMIKAVEKDERKKFLKAYAFSYDEEGNKIVEEELNKKGKIINRVIHKYENNRICQTKAAEGTTNFYYENDSLLKEETLNPDGSADIIQYIYNNQQLIQEKHYNIPQGEETHEDFLQKQIRYEYIENN